MEAGPKTLTLEVLGTSAAWPNGSVPSSCYLIGDGETTLVADLGHGAAAALGAREFDAIYLSHAHMDHVADFFAITYDLAFGQRSMTASKRSRPQLILSEDTYTRLRTIAVALGADDSFFAVYDLHCFADELIDHELGEFRLTTKRMDHFIPADALRVQSGNKSIVYSADLGASSGTKLAELAQKADLLLCEAAIPSACPADHVARGGHIDPRQAAAIAVDANVSRLLLTHVPNNYLPKVALAEAKAIFFASELAQLTSYTP